jgi:DNA-binding Lrp family transcriptional regulator
MAIQTKRTSQSAMKVMNESSLDSIDRNLVALLQTNARESVTTLGKKLGVARTTVSNRA